MPPCPLGPLLWWATAAAALSAGCRREEATPRARPAPAAQLALPTLPYAATAPVPPGRGLRRGVVLHRPDRAWPGYNLFTSRQWTEARLMDMAGEVVHRWHAPAAAPVDPRRAAPLQRLFAGWTHAVMDPAGNLYVVQELHSLLKLDWSSRLLWRLPLPVHHDLALDAAGQVWALTATPRRLRLGGRVETVLDNELVRISAGGEVLSRTSLLELLQASAETGAALRARLRGLAGWSAELTAEDLLLPPAMAEVVRLEDLAAALRGELPPRLAAMLLTYTAADVLHANTVALLPRAVPALGRPGDWLLCLRNLDWVVTVSAATGRVTWRWGEGVLSRPHQPSVLPDGSLLVFDNGVQPQRSRVLQLDPARREIRWRYAPSRFYVAWMGGSQGLPGGNVLITDSTAGRAFEVTRDGEVVWEYLAPLAEMPRPAAARVAPPRRAVTLYRMTRLPPEVARPLLAR